MRGILGRLFYALLLAIILGASTWVSFSRFVMGRALHVPELIGKSVEEAEAAASQRGLRLFLERSRSDFDEVIPAQRVRSQIPAAGTAVKSGQLVRVFLSLGPRTIRVPDLSGMTPRTASFALRKNGLQDGVLSYFRIASGTGIVAQGVEAGSIAQPGTRVDVLVARSAPAVAYIMPDLIGRDFERVRMGFEARGFRVGGVKEQFYEGAPVGTILRQYPLAGHPLTQKDVVTFVIASSEPSQSPG